MCVQLDLCQTCLETQKASFLALWLIFILTSADCPKHQFLSGVKLSGPLVSCLTWAVSNTGILFRIPSNRTSGGRKMTIQVIIMGFYIMSCVEPSHDKTNNLGFRPGVTTSGSVQPQEKAGS